jgi:tRNA-splicing ligase RtcB (3'-phosphate/5'-hydroxy nucleic acid ligase)
MTKHGAPPPDARRDHRSADIAALIAGATQERGVHRFRLGGVGVTLLLGDRLLRTVEPSALEQLHDALALPGLEDVVVTPDLHPGYGVPIGFTAVSSTHVYPDTVGPDPACSVSLSRITGHAFGELDKRARRAILDDLERVVVVDRRRGRTPYPPAIGFETLMEILTGRHRFPKTWVASHPPLPEWPSRERLGELESILRDLTTPRMLQQIGSIGGGNHFLEVQIGDDGDLYVMAHFGSRGLGAAGSRYFFERIRDLAPHDGVPVGPGTLLSLRADEPLGELYLMFQHAMLEYATYSHVAVQGAASDVLCRHLGVDAGAFLGHIPHNFIERRDGRYWQRKGATPAYDNDGIPLLIPGSMATTSYVLAPGPNASRYGESVPHGAGRVLSRGEARRTLDQGAMDRAFDAYGVMANFRHVPLDESSAAYKDVDEVIEAVVTPGVALLVNRLRPVLVLKGA